jgi:glycosyltransferase involved in cell wall biosynthesis
VDVCFVTEKCAILEIVRETGFCVPFGDTEAISERIKRALASNSGTLAQQRVTEMFTIEERRKNYRKL